MAHLAEARGVWGPFLVVAPASTLHNWDRELQQFTPGFKVRGLNVHCSCFRLMAHALCGFGHSHVCWWYEHLEGASVAAEAAHMMTSSQLCLQPCTGPWVVHSRACLLAALVLCQQVLPYWGTLADRKTLRRLLTPSRLYGRAAPFHVCLTSYQMAVADEAVLKKVKWQFMILDEAQVCGHCHVGC